MPQPACQRCRQPLTPVYPGQDELPAAEPATEPGHQSGRQPHGLAVALGLATLGWYIFPLGRDQRSPGQLPRLPRHPWRTAAPDRGLPVHPRRALVPRRPRRHH